MKLAYVATIAVTVWGCSVDLNESTTTTLNESSDSTSADSYLVGITMKEKDSNSTKDVKLIIYRNNDGYPTCVGAGGFGTNKHYVQLKKYGSGQWKVASKLAGTYDRYQNAGSNLLDVALHWTKMRGTITEATMSEAITGAKNSRLEYFSAKFDGKSYEYRHDADGNLGMTIGKLADTAPSQRDFNTACDS